MKKLLLFSLITGFTVSVDAQKLPSATIDASEEYQEAPPKINFYPARTETSAQTLIWSEDFSSGIPMDWTQNGTPALALWTYRGPNTIPNDSVGSIGCWAGPNNFGNMGDPILSPTRSNGFMIFDSDFLHSNGDRATNGSGSVPAPHVGRLRTDTIDLSNEAGAELSFYTYARRFQSAWLVAISTDGGATFSDTVEAFPATEVAVNGSTPQNAFYRANISAVVANQSEVVLEFVFDGNLSNTNGSGRYYWMIDDIELNRPPANFLRFTRATAPGTTGEAPSQDIIFGAGGGAKYLHLAEKQMQDVSFDGNIYNYGAQPQTNVSLEVEILDANNNSIASVSSASVAILNPLDTAYYTTLTTPAWTPTAAGDYRLVYKAVSDSIPATAPTAVDTFDFFVGDSYSIDDGSVGNYFGSNTGTNEMIAFGVMYSLENEDTAGAAGFVHLQGMEMEMSCLTDSTADMEIAIYDTAGFVFNTGFPGGASPIFTKVFTFDGSVPCNLVNFSLENAQGEPLVLPVGTYFVVSSLFPNATDGVIRFANSATWNQPGASSVFQNGNGDWFSGFSNSTTFEAPHYRLKIADPSSISLRENEMADFSVYPNPTTGQGLIEFSEAGQYKIAVHTMLGKTVYQRAVTVNANEKAQIDLGDLANGVYLLSLSNSEGATKTVRLTLKN